MSRKKYISNTMMKSFLLSVAISVVAEQLPVLVSPVLAGNFLGGHAIAALTLTVPVMELFYAVIFLLVTGSSYLAAEYISISDIDRLNKHFTVSTVSTLIVSAVLTLVFLLFNDSISLFLCDGKAELLVLIREYLPTIAFMFVPVSIYNILAYYFQAEGLIKMTISCSVAVAVIDLLLNYVFLSFFHMGLASFSLASIISLLAGSAYLLAEMKTKSLYRFVRVRNEFPDILRINLQKGLPLMLEELLSVAFLLLSNLIIVSSTDNNGPVVWGIANTFISLSSVIYIIISQSMITLGQENCSTKDYRGCRQIIRMHRLVNFIAISFFFSIVELFPDYVLTIFGESDIIDSYSILHLRLSACLMLIMSVVLLEATNYYVMNNYLRYLIAIAVIYSGSVLILFLFSRISPEYTWWGFFASTIACLLGSTFIRKVIRKQIYELDRTNVSVDLSICYDMSDIEPALNSIKSFLSENGTDSSTVLAMEHCVEELSYNIIKHVPVSIANKSFDFRAVQLQDSIVVLFKYGGRPFNPIIKFSDTAVEAERKGNKPQLALRIFNYYAKSPWYHYGYGVNTLSMTITRDSRPIIK